MKIVFCVGKISKGKKQIIHAGRKIDFEKVAVALTNDRRSK